MQPWEQSRNGFRNDRESNENYPAYVKLRYNMKFWDKEWKKKKKVKR